MALAVGVGVGVAVAVGVGVAVAVGVGVAVLVGVGVAVLVGVGLGVVLTGVLFWTVNVTADDVTHVPDELAALATTLWVPFATVVEFHDRDHGAAVAVTTWVPSTNHDTWTAVFDTDADSVVVPDTVAPAAGAVTDTRNGCCALADCAAVTSASTVAAAQHAAHARKRRSIRRPTR